MCVCCLLSRKLPSKRPTGLKVYVGSSKEVVLGCNGSRPEEEISLATADLLDG